MRFRYLGVYFTRLTVVIPFLWHNVIKEFSLKQKLQVNQPLKSRKSYSSSEENCPNSIREAAADLLHICSSSLQVVCSRHYVSGTCYTHKMFAKYVFKDIPEFSKSATAQAEFTDLRKFLQFCPADFRLGNHVPAQSLCSANSQEQFWAIQTPTLTHPVAGRYAHVHLLLNLAL